MPKMNTETPAAEVTPAGKRRVKNCIANSRCVACCEALDESRTIRGCHERCHRATERAIRDDLTTAQARISEGKWLPPNKTGRPVSNTVSLEVRKDT